MDFTGFIEAIEINRARGPERLRATPNGDDGGDIAVPKHVFIGIEIDRKNRR